MSRRQQKTGKHGQAIAAAALRNRGVLMVEEIATPVRLVPHKSVKGFYRVIYGEKVSGDHRGILPGGRSVLAETKTILDRNLRYGDLRPHQPERLTKHANEGGLSLLVWVHSTGAYVMEWTELVRSGFAPGTGMTHAEAWGLDVLELK